MALQPETVAEQFAVAPNVDRRTKAGKEQWVNFEQASKGWTVVTEDMIDQAAEMRDKLMSNDYVRQLLDGEREKPFFWVDELTGEECKCRVDCLTSINGMDIIVDLKTAESADTDTFMRHAIKYGYNLQAAMYGEGVKANTGKEHAFVFIVIEKKAPYAINILQADKTFITHGFDLFRELLGTYHECKTTGNWYGYLGKHNIINNLPLPAYLAKEIE
jgi:exodeoxyribonuclease VIII